MDEGSGVVRAQFYVPVALSDKEAVAVKAACGAVISSMPAMFSPRHPLMSGALKIEDAWRVEREKAEGES